MHERNLNHLKLNIYNLITQYCRKRKNCKQAGGVALFLNKNFDLQHEVIDVSSFCEEKIFEAVAIKVLSSNTNFFIISLYRSPKNCRKILDKFFTKLEASLIFLSKREGHIIIAGDLNIDLLKNDAKAKELKRLMTDYGLLSFVDTATRVTHDSRTCIDHVFSSIKIDDIVVETFKTKISDHYGNVVTLPKFFLEKEILYKNVRSFNPNNDKIFEGLMNSFDWGNIYEKNTDISTKFRRFFSAITNFFSTAYPKRRVKVDDRPKHFSRKKWFNNNLRLKRDIISNLNDAYKAYGEKSIKHRLHKEEKEYKILVEEAEKKNNSSIISNSKNPSQGAWKVINNYRNSGKENSNIKKLAVGDNVIENPTAICEHFNHFYINSATSSKKAAPKSLDNMPNFDCSLEIVNFSEDDIKTAITDLTNKNAVGDDEFSVGFILKFLDIFLPHLHYFY